jgi:tetratricopeptide (TPR) repeat protein
MKDNCKRTVGIIAKIMKHIFNVFFVIVVIYYGVTVLYDLTIRPIAIGKFPRLFEQVRNDFKHKAKIDEGDPIKMAAEAVSVSIKDLERTFRENSIEFKKAYDGKILRLTGTVDSIGERFSFDSADTYYIKLVDDPDRPFLNYVDVYLRKDEAHKLDDLVIGQTITIVGKCTNESWSVDVKDAFFEKDDLDQTIDDYTEVIRLNPKDAIAYNNRGLAYDSKGFYDHAIADYTEAIRLDPNLVVAYNNRGSAYDAKGDYDRAIADYTEAIRLDPNFSTSYYKRGDIYNDKGDYDHAITDYTEAIRLDPNFPIAYNNRDSAYHNKDDYDYAITDNTEAIQLNLNLAIAYNSRGMVYYNKGDYDHAIGDFDEAIRLNPNYGIAYNNRGSAYNNKGDYDHAIVNLDQSIRLVQNIANPYRHRAYAYMQKGNFTQARVDVDMALQINPDYQSAQTLSDELRERGY